ncbi:nuclear transport factor 2 family protein [Pseudomonas sp. Z1-14]|uniref:nuclear transport factor 2 family protein n=1 Tax=Pseudomonas sp. Z1-14 TaxID=2817409 RepID=UPI003DA7BC1E
MVDLQRTLAQLTNRIVILEAENEVRRVQMRYMALCDTPVPEYGVRNPEHRIDLIMELFSDEAVWEGVGEYYNGQFGRAEGKKAVRQFFEGFHQNNKDRKIVLNCHYVTSEQIHVAADGITATGQWVHIQPWLFSNGEAVLRSSRLFNAYKLCEDGKWRFTRNRTENVFIAPLHSTWASDYPSESILLKP